MTSSVFDGLLIGGIVVIGVLAALTKSAWAIAPLAVLVAIMVASMMRLRRAAEHHAEEVERGYSERAALFEEIAERKRAIIDNAFDAILTIDEDGLIESVNPAGERMFGYAAAELLGRNVSILMPEPYRSEHDRYMRSYLETGQARIVGAPREVSGLKKDGTVFPLGIAITEVRFRGRRRFVGLLRDTSERYEAEEQRKVLVHALEAAANAVIITDQSGRINWVNRAFTELTGFTPEEMVGQSTRVLKSGHHDQAFYNKLWERISGGGIWRGEVINRRKDGSLYNEDMTITPVRDREGRIGRYIAIKQDVTEQRRAADALRQSEERYRDLFENTTDMILVLTPDGRVAYANRAFQDALGYSEKDLTQLALADFVDKDHPLRAGEQDGITLSDEEPKQEAVFVARDGRRLTVEGTLGTRYVDGKPAFRRGIFRDVTHRKEVEKLKSEFISTVSHELRTPLTCIRGALGILDADAIGRLPEQMRSLIEVARTNSERLVRLINDILFIERIGSERMVFRIQPTEVMPLLDRAIGTYSPYAEQYGVAFAVTDRLQGAWVKADEDRLEQVIANLLSNAAKFSPEGEVVSVSVLRVDGAVRVRITDKGPGIPEEFRARIFQSFAQADSSDARQKGGTGLGLSISKEIIDRLGGNIGFDSAPGRGTTFFFELPEWKADRTET